MTRAARPSRVHPLTSSAGALIFCWAAACIGEVEQDQGTTTGSLPNASHPPVTPGNRPVASDTNIRGTTGDGQDRCTAPVQPALPRQLRRLTSSEHLASLQTALELPDFAAQLPPDPAGPNGLNNNSQLLIVGPTFVDRAAHIAQQAARAFTEPAHLQKALPCSDDVQSATCAAYFINRFGRRVFRRPLTEVEQASYLSRMQQIQREHDLPSALRWALATLLQSPNFLYRSELGTPQPDGTALLDAYEAAAILAYSLTGQGPDDALLDAARDGALDTPEDRRQAAFDLLHEHPLLAKRVLDNFLDQWLGLAALQTVGKDHPAFTPAIRSAMADEMRLFLDLVIWEQRGGLTELLTSRNTVLDGTLSRFYGYGKVTQGNRVVQRPSAWSTGLLAQGSLLALHASNLHSSPTRRGHFVRSRLLCQSLPAAPEGVDGFPPVDARTTRARHQALLDTPTCSECHVLMDATGFAFETFDELGRLRSEEAGEAIEDSGVLVGTSQGNSNFVGATDLSRQLAALPETHACLAGFLSSYATGLSPQETQCMFEEETTALRTGAMGIVDYYVHVIATSAASPRGM